MSPSTTTTRILVLADLLSSRAPDRPETLEEAAALGDLVARHAPQIVLEVPNRLGSSPAALELRLTLSRLKDLAPEALIGQLPPLQRLQQLAARLEALEAGERPPGALEAILNELDGAAELDAVPDLARQLRQALDGGAAPHAPAPPAEGEAEGEQAQGGALDRILELVEVPEHQRRASAAVDHLVSAVGGGGRRAAPGLKAAAASAREALGRQLDLVYHHPELQRLESAWRGLKRLVDATSFRDGVRLEVLHAPVQELSDRFLEAICRPILDGVAEPPTLIIAAYGLENPAVQAELIQRLAEGAESIQAPLLLSVGPGFLGLDAARAAADLRGAHALLERPEYTKLNALRAKGCARWIALAFNRFLLRPLHEGASYRERAQGAADRLWGDPAWAVAALVARSAARCGWPTQITGTDEGKLGDLPLHPFVDGAGRSIGQICTEAPLSRQVMQDLAGCGLIALSSPVESDAAYVLRAPSLFKDRGGTVGSFVYQLFVTRVAHRVNALLPGLVGRTDPQAIRDELERELGGLLAGTGIGASAVVTTSTGAGGRLDVHVEIRSGRGILGGAELALDLALR